MLNAKSNHGTSAVTAGAVRGRGSHWRSTRPCDRTARLVSSCRAPARASRCPAARASSSALCQPARWMPNSAQAIGSFEPVRRSVSTPSPRSTVSRPTRPNSLRSIRASNPRRLWPTRHAPCIRDPSSSAMSSKRGAPTTSRALMPWIEVGPTSRPGSTSVLHSSTTMPSRFKVTTATSMTRSELYRPVVSRSTTAKRSPSPAIPASSPAP